MHLPFDKCQVSFKNVWYLKISWLYINGRAVNSVHAVTTGKKRKYMDFIVKWIFYVFSNLVQVSCIKSFKFYQSVSIFLLSCHVIGFLQHMGVSELYVYWDSISLVTVVYSLNSKRRVLRSLNKLPFLLCFSCFWLLHTVWYDWCRNVIERKQQNMYFVLSSL